MHYTKSTGTEILITEMGVSNEAKNAPLKLCAKSNFFFPLVNSIRGHRYCVYPVLKSAEILVGEKLLIAAIHVIFSMSEDGKAKNVNYLRPRQCMLICRQIFCI
jgi:hypothetical protein